MSWSKSIPRRVFDAITSETQGEIVRWAGQPDARASFWQTTPVWLMGVPWLALSGGMFGVLVAAVLAGPPADRVVPPWEFGLVAMMIIFIGSFVLIGIGMVGAPFYVWWKSRHMVYAITDRRLVRIIVGRQREVASFDPATFASIKRRQRRDGRGTLEIVTGYEKDSDGDRVASTELVVGVPDAAVADQLLQSMMRGGTAGR